MGALIANNSSPVDFVVGNIKIEPNVIETAHAVGARRLSILGSSCLYARDGPRPMRQEYLLTDPLEATQRPYVLAKIAGIECCWSNNRRYGMRRFGHLAMVPTNLYGVGDSFELQSSHVLPALIRKMHEAKSARQAQFTIWRSGTPKRGFLHADDPVRALVFLATLGDVGFSERTNLAVCPLISIGTGENLTIRELSETIAAVVGFRGQIVYDRSKPDSTPRKLLDVSRIHALGWTPAIALHDGTGAAYRGFLAHTATS